MGQKNHQKVAKNATLAKSRQNGKKCQNRASACGAGPKGGPAPQARCRRGPEGAQRQASTYNKQRLKLKTRHYYQYQYISIIFCMQSYVSYQNIFSMNSYQHCSSPPQNSQQHTYLACYELDFDVNFELFLKGLTHSQSGVIVLDSTGHCTFLNQFFLHFFSPHTTSIHCHALTKNCFKFVISPTIQEVGNILETITI